MAAQTAYTQMGMMASQGIPVQRRTEGGQDVYYKTFPFHLRDQMYHAYDMLHSIGVGIPFTRTPNGVRMEGGTVLPRAIKQGMITSATKGTLIAQIQGLQRALLQANWAHTDVKPENLVIMRGSGRVYLIDCDFALPFGQARQVGTPGVNITYGGANEMVGPGTDAMGFQSVINAISYGF